MIRKVHSSSILTQELCEDDSSSLKIQDISQYFCASDSVTGKGMPYVREYNANIPLPLKQSRSYYFIL